MYQNGKAALLGQIHVVEVEVLELRLVARTGLRRSLALLLRNLSRQLLQPGCDFERKADKPQLVNMRKREWKKGVCKVFLSFFFVVSFQCSARTNWRNGATDKISDPSTQRRQ